MSLNSSVVLGVLALGFAVWHIAKMLSEGSLFWPWREWRDEKLVTYGWLGRKLQDGWSCRLCFGTQWAVLVTWTVMIVVRISYGALGIPMGLWGVSAALLPMTIAGVAEALRKFE